MKTGSALLGQEFDDPRKHLLPVLALQRQRQLGHEDAVSIVDEVPIIVRWLIAAFPQQRGDFSIVDCLGNHIN